MAGGLLGRLGGKGHAGGKKFAVALSEEEWRAKLSAAQYRVLRQHGTERAGSSPLDKEHGAGIFHCAGCGQPLFAAAAKFNSGTGWPSFSEPLADAVETEADRSLFMVRNEVHCSRCGGHLGHVFDDGPQPTGQRYCMNGVSLEFHAGEPHPGDAGEAGPEAGKAGPDKAKPASG
jgi:peptide-methionine (R)-S-oxide reductase